MRYYFILLLSSTIFCFTDVDVVQDDIKMVQAGEDVNLTCNFSELLDSTVWYKQTAEGKSLQIVYLYLEQTTWNKNFTKMNRFNVIRGNYHFNLTILKTNPSDSATYYCVVAAYWKIGMGAGTRLIVRDAAIPQTTIQQSLIDSVHPGYSVNLQCSIFTESCAEEHSVYWFRQSSGDSQGVLYTKGERNGQCNKSSESQTQSCVYNLLKSNISHSDTGIYYCAVAACGEILFGKGTRLNYRVSGDVNLTLALGILNIIFLALVVCLGIKLCRGQNKVSTPQESQNEDTMNYAAISFAQKPLNTRRTKSKIIQDQSLYAQVRSQQ